VLHEVHQAGQTLVLVTHDRTIGASGTRLVQVRDGRIVYDGSPEVLNGQGTTAANGTLAPAPANPTPASGAGEAPVR
jgi:putative ABC transport system ATP-binding protein